MGQCRRPLVVIAADLVSFDACLHESMQCQCRLVVARVLRAILPRGCLLASVLRPLANPLAFSSGPVCEAPQSSLALKVQRTDASSSESILSWCVCSAKNRTNNHKTCAQLNDDGAIYSKCVDFQGPVSGSGRILVSAATGNGNWPCAFGNTPPPTTAESDGAATASAAGAALLGLAALI